MRALGWGWALSALAAAGCLDDEAANQARTANPGGGWPAVDCATYCALARARCSRAPGWAPYLASCPEACAGLPAGGRVGDVVGDTLGCRMTYLLLVAPRSQNLCLHAAPAGGVPCTADAASQAHREPQ